MATSAAGAPHRPSTVDVIFTVRCDGLMKDRLGRPSFDQRVFVVGAPAALGAWDTSRALPLRCTDEAANIWSSEPVALPIEEAARRPGGPLIPGRGEGRLVRATPFHAHGYSRCNCKAGF